MPLNIISTSGTETAWKIAGGYIYYKACLEQNRGKNVMF
jgi:hypothetical protein